MQFRWVSLIALWTILSGPVLGPPTGGSPSAKERSNDRPAASKPTTLRR
jgi:hypothetical protein